MGGGCCNPTGRLGGLRLPSLRQSVCAELELDCGCRCPAVDAVYALPCAASVRHGARRRSRAESAAAACRPVSVAGPLAGTGSDRRWFFPDRCRPRWTAPVPQISESESEVASSLRQFELESTGLPCIQVPSLPWEGLPSAGHDCICAAAGPGAVVTVVSQLRLGSASLRLSAPVQCLQTRKSLNKQWHLVW